jgi:uncharacterized membrane protein
MHDGGALLRTEWGPPLCIFILFYIVSLVKKHVLGHTTTTLFIVAKFVFVVILQIIRCDMYE